MTAQQDSPLRRLAAAPYRWQRRRLAPRRFEHAYRRYWEDGVVSADANRLLNEAFWASGGTLPSARAREYAPPFDPGALAGFRDDCFAQLDVASAVASLRDAGYYVMPERLSTSTVDALEATLERGPAEPRGDGLDWLKPGAPAPSAPTWWMYGSAALQSPAVRELVTERRPVEVAGTYLGSDPLVMSLVLWKSYEWRSVDSSSAQLFHYDFDRASFLKMFVYLTDVGPENGPHTYVPRSHREKPAALLDGRRLTDDEVAREYPSDSWATICGPRGTVFFADTLGFHKGQRVLEGSRSIFQICFGSDRFGYAAQSLSGAAASSPEDIRPMVERHPRYFSELYDVGPVSP